MASFYGSHIAQRCVLPVYYGSNKSTGKETGKTHLCAFANGVCFVVIIKITPFYIVTSSITDFYNQNGCRKIHLGMVLFYLFVGNCKTKFIKNQITITTFDSKSWVLRIMWKRLPYPTKSWFNKLFFDAMLFFHIFLK